MNILKKTVTCATATTISLFFGSACAQNSDTKVSIPIVAELTPGPIVIHTPVQTKDEFTVDVVTLHSAIRDIALGSENEFIRINFTGISLGNLKSLTLTNYGNSDDFDFIDFKLIDSKGNIVARSEKMIGKKVTFNPKELSLKTGSSNIFSVLAKAINGSRKTIQLTLEKPADIVIENEGQILKPENNIAFPIGATKGFNTSQIMEGTAILDSARTLIDRKVRPGTKDVVVADYIIYGFGEDIETSGSFTMQIQGGQKNLQGPIKVISGSTTLLELENIEAVQNKAVVFEGIKKVKIAANFSIPIRVICSIANNASIGDMISVQLSNIKITKSLSKFESLIATTPIMSNPIEISSEENAGYKPSPKEKSTIPKGSTNMLIGSFVARRPETSIWLELSEYHGLKNLVVKKDNQIIGQSSIPLGFNNFFTAGKITAGDKIEIYIDVLNSASLINLIVSSPLSDGTKQILGTHIITTF